MPKDKHLGLFIDPELHHKLRYAAEYDGRSISGEIMYVLRQYLAGFEREHGPIPVPENANPPKA